MTTRPTELKLYTDQCPGAVALYRQGAPQDRSIFHVGTAAHEVLEGLTSGIPAGDTVARLVTEGRKGQDAEPPIPSDAALRGADLARRWVETHGTPQGTPEMRLGLTAGGEPTTGADALIATRIDLVWEDEVEGPEGPLFVAVARDYKSSWQADADELDTVQRRVHAVLMWLHFPDADGVRVEVGNLRTRAIHEHTLWRGVDEPTIEQWARDIGVIAGAIHAGALDFSPGANCLGCSYAGHCPAAWSLATDPEADPVRRYVAAKAAAAALEPLARKATAEAPRDIEGGSVGWSERVKRATHDQTVPALLSAWEGFHGPDYTRETVAALLDSIGVGVGQVTSLGKSLWRGRGSREPREALANEALTEKAGRSWGVWRD